MTQLTTSPPQRLLQEKCVDIRTARTVFNFLRNEFQDMNVHLSPSSHLVHNPIFEEAIVNVISGVRDEDLSPNEVHALRQFRKTSSSKEAIDSESLVEQNDLISKLGSIITTAKKQRMETQSTVPVESSFIDLRWIPSTSDTVERLFSTAKLMLTDKRTRLAPELLEAMLFLKANKKYYPNSTVMHAAIESSRVNPYMETIQFDEPMFDY
jgi:hypothetical protein